jgi:2-keto-4-pentenoate hydratase/2-oxohepta-3-ene-1,7-dioic acid hydratase in catechol pathway
MRLRTTPDGLIVDDPASGGWISLPAALRVAGREHDDALAAAATDALAFLRGGADVREAAAALLDDVRGEPGVAADPAAAVVPFAMRSLRAFSVWESHMVGSARTIARRFMPAPVGRVAGAFERVTGRTFPPFKPKPKFYEVPAFYMGNHTAVLADGEDVGWPRHTGYLDFELELAFVLARPVADCTPQEGRAAIGGWFVLNDWSARDVQADDYRRNVFGPVVKAKTFATSIGCDVVTADEIPDWTAVTGRVRVDGEVWCEGATAGAAHDVGDMVAHAALGEHLDAGDVLATGTMPGCCGLELDRWITPGQTVRLEIDGIGTLTNRVVRAPAPAPATPRVVVPA